MVKVKDLPIYGQPKSVDFEYVPENVSAFRKGVSDVRVSIWDAATIFEDSWKQAKNVGGGLRDYVKDTVKYIQEDSTVLQRAGVITVSGLGGVVLGYRGGVLRKATLASAGMLTAASICYPNQAVDISRRGWAAVKDQAQEVLDQVPVQKPSFMTSSTSTQSDSKDKLAAAPNEGKQVDASKMDFGQSKAEDKDMYTTRES